jgi:hypothetical protein
VTAHNKYQRRHRPELRRYRVIPLPGIKRGWYVQDSILGYCTDPVDSRAEAQAQADDLNRMDKAGLA